MPPDPLLQRNTSVFRPPLRNPGSAPDTIILIHTNNTTNTQTAIYSLWSIPLEHHCPTEVSLVTSLVPWIRHRAYFSILQYGRNVCTIPKMPPADDIMGSKYRKNELIHKSHDLLQVERFLRLIRKWSSDDWLTGILTKHSVPNY